MATAQLHQPGGKAGCGSGGSGWLPRRSCSTEAANTSGALSDGGHTVYQDSTFSRERSTSAVRLEDGAALLGYREDPRSTTSTPARPVAVSRLDEQQQHHHQAHDAHDKRDALECSREGELERRLPQSQRWRALSLLRLVDTSYYDAQVPAGWRRWRYASSGILCRPLVVDSLDGIVRYIHGSRLAFYTAVAFLDRFIAATVDPVANFQAYRRQILRARTGQEMDFTMMAGSGLGGPGSSDLHDGSAFRAHGAGGGGGRAAADAHTAQQQQQLFSDDVHARDICGFLTQVIVVCIMLGSKTVDLYPPRIRQLMGCVEDTAPISEQEFVILELHVLLTLGFPVHPVTLFESINALLTFSTSDDLIATLTASHTTRRLLEEYQDRGHLVDDVDKLLREQAERDAASAVHGSGVSVRQSPSHGQSGEAIAAAAKAASSGGHHPHARPTAALTRVDRQAMNDWLRLRLFAYFVCDEVIRADATGASRAASSNENSRHASPHGSAGASRHHRHPHTRHHHQHGHSQQPGEDDDEDDHHNSSSSGNSTDSEMSDGANVLQYAPVLVAAAALVVAAEQVRLPLPTPLLRLLPQTLAERLRFGCNEEAATRSPDPTSPLDPAPPLTSASARGGGAAVDPLRLTAQPADDNYAVLAELSVLLEAELLRLSASRRRLDNLLSPACEGEEEEEAAAAAAATAGGAFGASALLGHGKRGNTRCGAVRGSPSVMSPSSLSARADPYAVNLFGEVIGQVRAIHERSRESCPPVLLQRYQPLFREEI